MGESNGAWGQLAAHDDEMAEVFDGFERLPDPGANVVLDAFCERKNIDIPSLVRLGARIEPPNVLVFAFPGGLKFRDAVTDHRWSYAGSTWADLKIVRAQRGEARIAIVAEGETDGARLSILYPEADIAVLPAGADPRPHTASYAKQLAAYDLVLMAHDNDQAGNDGAALLSEALVGKVLRWLPPGDNDWCSIDPALGPVALPDPDLVDVPVESRLLVKAGDLLDLEPPPIVSYFDNALLPIGGQLVIHGWAKSFKSYLALDLAGAIAQAAPWGSFEPLEEPTKVAVMQYEIPWAFLQQRVRQLLAKAETPDLYRENLLVWTPMQRPGYRAGNKAYEDAILKALTDAGVGVFVLDPIRRATGAVDLNSEKDVRPLLEFYERLQGEGIAVITCHHDKKSERGSGDMAAMTGSGAFAGDADSIISVALPKGEDPESGRRNMHYTFRNAPSISPHGFEMTEAGVLVYQGHAWAAEEDDTPTEGSVDEAI